MTYPITANIEVNNTENFYQVFDVTDLAPLYNFAAGVFRTQMRLTAIDPVIQYEWSTLNGGIKYYEVAASDSILYTNNPLANDTITIGTTTVTFVASGASGLQSNISGTVAATLAALVIMLNASNDPELSLCKYSLIGTTLMITSKATGYFGNSIAVAATTVGVTVGEPTLTGGTNLIVLQAPLASTESFSGVYEYDCRFEYTELQYAVLFGGTIQWDQGVTRETTDLTIDPNTIPIMASVAITPDLLNALIFG